MLLERQDSEWRELFVKFMKIILIYWIIVKQGQIIANPDNIIVKSSKIIVARKKSLPETLDNSQIREDNSQT